jgi:hypothetical protein
VAPFGIGVTLIQPGAVRTRFMASGELYQPADNEDSPYAVYKANVAKMAARANRDGGPGVLEAGDVAAVILKAVTAGRYMGTSPGSKPSSVKYTCRSGASPSCSGGWPPTRPGGPSACRRDRRGS